MSVCNLLTFWSRHQIAVGVNNNILVMTKQGICQNFLRKEFAPWYSFETSVWPVSYHITMSRIIPSCTLGTITLIYLQYTGVGYFSRNSENVHLRTKITFKITKVDVVVLVCKFLQSTRTKCCWNSLKEHFPERRGGNCSSMVKSNGIATLRCKSAIATLKCNAL